MALVFVLTNSNTSYFRNTGPSYEKEIDQPNTNDGNNSRHICIFAYCIILTLLPDYTLIFS